MIVTGLLLSHAIHAAEASADPESTILASTVDNTGVPLIEVVEAVARRSQKRFIVDPRLAGNVRVPGLDIRKTTFRELQAILRVHGFATVEVEGTTSVVPDANLRSMPIPVIDRNPANIGDDDAVMKIVGTGKLDAVMLVPLLRPLLPQYAHLAAEKSTNSLIIVARYGNIKAIESLIRELEKRPTDSRELAQP
jgi:general secretion pathway protein D